MQIKTNHLLVDIGVTLELFSDEMAFVCLLNFVDVLALC